MKLRYIGPVAHEDSQWLPGVPTNHATVDIETDDAAWQQQLLNSGEYEIAPDADEAGAPDQAAEVSARPEAAEVATEGASVAASHEQAAGSTPAAAEVGDDVDLAAEPAAPEPVAATGGNPGADPAHEEAS